MPSSPEPTLDSESFPQLTWHRLAPWRVMEEEPLRKIGRYLTEPDTQLQLRALDEAREYPRAVRQELHRLGLSQIFTGRTNAAGGPSFVHMAALAATAAYASGSLAITVGVNGLALLPLYHEANDEQLSRAFDHVEAGAYCSLLLTERAHGSNLLGNETSARQARVEVNLKDKPLHYVVNGEKHLINGGTCHELLMTLVRTGKASAKDGFAARNDFSMLMIERDATVAALPRWGTLPVPAADISGVSFKDTKVPFANRVGEEGSGFSLVQKTLMISRGGIGALASGCASRAASMAADYAEQRNIYGQPIIRLGAIAEGVLRVKSLDLLIASMSLKATAMTNASGIGAAHYTSAAKYACCLLAEELVTEGRLIHGGAALLTNQPYQSLVRDVLLYGIFDGTSHLMLDQLQWRLAQTAALTPPSASLLGPMGALISQPSQNIIRVLRERHSTVLPPTVAYLRELDLVEGEVSLRPLALACEELFSCTRECRKRKIWDGDQALRFAAGHAFALVETLIALVEFCDPSRRLALGLPAVVHSPDKFPLSFRHAFSWFGLRVVNAVRAVRAQSGISGVSELENAESMLVPVYTDARRQLLAELTSEPTKANEHQ